MASFDKIIQIWGDNIRWYNNNYAKANTEKHLDNKATTLIGRRRSSVLAFSEPLKISKDTVF